MNIPEVSQSHDVKKYWRGRAVAEGIVDGIGGALSGWVILEMSRMFHYTLDTPFVIGVLGSLPFLVRQSIQHAYRDGFPHLPESFHS